MGYVCFNVIDGFLFNLNIKPGTACKHILFSIILLEMKLNLPDHLNDDLQNVIYVQINLMIVGSYQANEVQLCTKSRSVLTVSVLCGALSMHLLSSSQLQSYKLHSHGTDLLHFTHTGS